MSYFASVKGDKYELFITEEATDTADKKVQIKKSIGTYEVSHLEELKAQYQGWIDEIDSKLSVINAKIVEDSE
jgi:hypothetical protein